MPPALALAIAARAPACARASAAGSQPAAKRGAAESLRIANSLAPALSGSPSAASPVHEQSQSLSAALSSPSCAKACPISPFGANISGVCKCSHKTEPGTAEGIAGNPFQEPAPYAMSKSIASQIPASLSRARFSAIGLPSSSSKSRAGASAICPSCAPSGNLASSPGWSHKYTAFPLPSSAKPRPALASSKTSASASISANKSLWALSLSNILSNSLPGIPSPGFALASLPFWLDANSPLSAWISSALCCGPKRLLRSGSSEQSLEKRHASFLALNIGAAPWPASIAMPLSARAPSFANCAAPNAKAPWPGNAQAPHENQSKPSNDAASSPAPHSSSTSSAASSSKPAGPIRSSAPCAKPSAISHAMSLPAPEYPCPHMRSALCSNSSGQAKPETKSRPRRLASASAVSALCGLSIPFSPRFFSFAHFTAAPPEIKTRPAQARPGRPQNTQPFAPKSAQWRIMPSMISEPLSPEDVQILRSELARRLGRFPEPLRRAAAALAPNALRCALETDKLGKDLSAAGPQMQRLGLPGRLAGLFDPNPYAPSFANAAKDAASAEIAQAFCDAAEPGSNPTDALACCALLGLQERYGFLDGWGAAQNPVCLLEEESAGDYTVNDIVSLNFSSGMPLCALWLLSQGLRPDRLLSGRPNFCALGREQLPLWRTLAKAGYGFAQATPSCGNFLHHMARHFKAADGPALLQILGAYPQISLEYTDFNKLTPLHKAVKHKNPDLCAFLAGQGALVHERVFSGDGRRIPLCQAAAGIGSQACADILLAAAEREALCARSLGLDDHDKLRIFEALSSSGALVDYQGKTLSFDALVLLLSGKGAQAPQSAAL